MKIIITAALIAATVASAHAFEVKTCKDVYQLAFDVMVERQTGRPLPDMMEAVERLSDAKTQSLARVMVRHAYKSPSYQTPQFQEEAIQEFANQAMLSCLEAGKR